MPCIHHLQNDEKAADQWTRTGMASQVSAGALILEEYMHVNHNSALVVEMLVMLSTAHI
jgi:hypothetical protein